MPLYPKAYQPYFLDPNSPSRYSCAGEYLYPVIPSDLMYWQGFQTPCGQNIVEDPEFANSTLGAELLTNGSFTGALAPWGTTGTWAYGTNNAIYTTSVGISNLIQAIVASVGDLLEVTFTVSGSFNGGSMGIYVGTSLLAQVTDPGTYTISGVYATGATSFYFQIPALSPISSLTLDDVSVKVITMTDWDGNGEWSFDGLLACHTIAGTGDLINLAANYIVSGKRYRVTFTLSGNSAGTITPNVGLTPSTAQSGNGIKTVWINATGNGVLSFTPTSNFVGCISEIDVREMKVAADFTWQIISDLGDGDVYDMVNYVELEEDTLTLIYDPEDAGLPDGCYVMRIFDTCTVQYDDVVTNGIFADGLVSSVPGWNLNNGAYQYDFSADNAEFIYDPITGATNLLTNGDFSSGSLSSWTAAAGWAYSAGKARHTAGNTGTLSQTVNIVGTLNPTVRTQFIQFTISNRTAGSVTVQLSDGTSSSFSANDLITLQIGPTVYGAVTFSITPTSTFDGDIDDVQVVELVNTPWIKFPVLYNLSNPNIVAGNYEATFEIISNTNLTNIGIAVTIDGLPVTPVYYSAVGVHVVSLPGYVTGSQRVALIGKFTDFLNSYPGSIVVDNVSVYRVEPFVATYNSVGISYRPNQLHTRLIRGYCTTNNLGYIFENTDFYIQQRVKIRSINPAYPSSSGITKSGNGNARLYYGELEKYFTVFTDLLDESAHDAMAVMLQCTEFEIQGDDNQWISFIPDGDPYDVQWFPGGVDSATAPASFNIRIKAGGQIFNRQL